MNYEQEIKEIEKSWNYCDSNGWHFASRLLTLAKKMQAEIKELSACREIEVAAGTLRIKQEESWIPWSERLPEDEKWCLVTIEDRDDDGSKILTTKISRFLKKYDAWAECGIIAWMPLPQPYHEK